MKIRLTRQAIAQGVALTRAKDESAFRFLARQVEAVISACPTCEGDWVTVYAGSHDRDEGFCELRRCPGCSDDMRLGRSDVPMCTEQVGEGNGG